MSLNKGSSLIAIKAILKIVAIIGCALPAVAVLSLLLFAPPDLESWLSDRYVGVSRKDAFDGVNKVFPLFATTICITSLVACIFACGNRFRYIVYLALGPLIATCMYVIGNGMSDPAWMTFLAMNTIGMFVSVVVTCAIYVCSTFMDRTVGGVARRT